VGVGTVDARSQKAKPLQPGRVTGLGDALEQVKVALTKLWEHQFGFKAAPQATKPVPVAKQKNPQPNDTSKTTQKPCTKLSEEYDTFIKCGGSAAWRNNNPGNIIYTSTSVSTFGALGKSTSATRFAKFPDEAAGTAALIKLLQGSLYKDKLPADAMKVYAPSSDDNDPVAYAKFLVDHGIDPKKKVGEQAEQMAPLIKRREGWIEGTIIPKKPPAKK